MTHSKDFTELLRTRVQDQGIKYGLQRIQKAMEELGHPEQRLAPVIHIAGTNGKGSTLAAIDQLLRQHGQRVGTFTSPHLYSYTERIRLQGVPVDNDALYNAIQKVVELPCQSQLTEFEILVAAAIIIFSESDLDFLVIETGLGGRLDASNILNSVLTIITRIGLDHQDLLGDSLAEIAGEKAGIIKPGVPLITLKYQAADVSKVLKKHCYELAAEYIPVEDHSLESEAPIPQYQHENLSMAEAAYEYLQNAYELPALTHHKIVFPDGRFQVLSIGGRTWIQDVAHNPQAAEALVTALHHEYPGGDIGIICGVKPGKDLLGILSAFSDFPLYYCDFEGGVPSTVVEDSFPTIRRHHLGESPPDHEILVWTGSFYFLEAVGNMQVFSQNIR